MENQSGSTSPIAPMTDQIATKTPPDPSTKTKKMGLLAPILVTFLLTGIIFGLGGFYLGKMAINSGFGTDTNSDVMYQDETTSSPSPTAAPSKTSESESTVNGVDLADITYDLPDGWESKTEYSSLTLSPKTGGGYLYIEVYGYESSVGRREHYCTSVHSVCTEDTTFTPATIGNISGYKATGIDNSNAGTEYFGAKGNRFYVVTVSNPPPPNEFLNSYQDVMNSLVF